MSIKQFLCIGFGCLFALLSVAATTPTPTPTISPPRAKLTKKMLDNAKRLEAAAVSTAVQHDDALLLKKSLPNIPSLEKKLLKNLKRHIVISREKILPPPQFTLHSWQIRTKQAIAHQIGWVDDPKAGNVCCGYYQVPLLNPEQKIVLPLPDSQTEIKAMQTQFEQHGASVLVGKVVSKQPGRLLTAEQAYLYRDSQSGKINAADFYGDVHLFEPNKLITGQYAQIRFDSDEAEINHAIYRINTKITAEKEKPAEVVSGYKRIFSLNAWGRALKIKKIKQGLFDLFRVSYTTCVPTHTTWVMRARKITLDQNAGWGKAWHSKLFVKGVPLFYWPYFDFPIDDRRKSGFLYPSYGQSKINGFTLTAPYYWNMAPNYDWLLTPVLMTHRGLQLNNQFRFLTIRDKGEVNFNLLPNDRLFKKFRNNASLVRYPGRESELSRLQSMQANRWQFRFIEKTTYNPNWESSWDIHRVSDDYYFQDFTSTLGTEDQLAQQFKLNYKDKILQSDLTLRNYQTLHPVNESALGNPYNQLPAWRFVAKSPLSYGMWQYETRGELVNFTHYPTPAETQSVPFGQRMWLRPGVSYPIRLGSTLITPSVKLDLAQDFVHRQASGLRTEPHRAIPLFVLKGQHTFKRNVRWFKQAYTQTLEPEAQYLYVPVHFQRNFPNFSTGLSSFSYATLFSENRFSDVDRLGDANQMALGFTTRLLEPNGRERMVARVAELLYFKDRQVTLCSTPGCQDIRGISNKNRHSPIATNLDYQINDYWKTGAEAMWETNDTTPLSQSVHLNYRADASHLFNIGYTFSQPQTPFTVGGLEVNREDQELGIAPKELTTSLIWPFPVLKNWTMIGYAHYDVAHHHALGTYWGAEYNSCCFAVRALSARQFKLNDYPSGRHIYDNTFYLQFIFKGLGSYGLHNPNGLLSQINNYQDPYRMNLTSSAQQMQ